MHIQNSKTSGMKLLPNVISVLRVAGSIGLLFCDVAGVIVFIKMVNQVSALAVFKRFCFPHTWANKLTGFLLFLSVPTMFWSMIPISIVAAIATFAAVQEGHYIRAKQVENQCLKINNLQSLVVPRTRLELVRTFLSKGF